MSRPLYDRPGENINYLNTGAAPLLEGAVVALGTKGIGIVAHTIPPNEVGTVWVAGVWRMPKSNAAIALGDEVTYDAATGQVSAGGSGVPAGWAVQDAGAPDEVALVKIG